MSDANITHFMRWLGRTRGLPFTDYEGLWQWSVSDIDAFWASIWDYFEVLSVRPPKALTERRMPGARWFLGARLNYAEHALRRRDNHLAVIAYSEAGPTVTLTYSELFERAASAAAGLRRLGVKAGDRVAAFLPNIPEALIGFLATASVGAIWSSCSPDFGTASVVDRFSQIKPKVLFATDGYRYAGRVFSRLDVVEEIRRALPDLEHTVLVPSLEGERGPSGVLAWTQFLEEPSKLSFEQVSFEHPLWVLFSSGATGPPKPILQSHGGILLEHLKALSLHLDLKPEDRFFWFTTTGWMMWNLLISGLLLGTTVVLYDGAPLYPDEGALWHLADEGRITYFGTSAPFIAACMRAGIQPRREFGLVPLQSVGSTASPLPPEGFTWVYENVKQDVLLGSISGGTDICTSLLMSCPLLPVHAGELQCRALGVKVEAYDERGQPLVNEVGELVITEPMPSMPVALWGDRDGHRYHESYFDTFPGIWRHGDWIRITSRGTAVITGRSDSTLNRGGVRMGSSEFYRVVESLPEVQESLVIHASHGGEGGSLLLFVVLRPEVELDSSVRRRIVELVRRELSPRYVPDNILRIAQVPRTFNGKKLEVPIRRILEGMPVEDAVNLGSVANPEALVPFQELAGDIASRG